MRIIYLHQYFTTPQGNGGTRSYEFARRWIVQGHQVHVIASDSYLPEEYRVKKTSQTDIDGISMTLIPSNYSNFMGYRARIFAFIQFALVSTWYALTRPADIIYASSTPLTIAIPALIAATLRRKPMVFEIRDLWPEGPIKAGILRNRTLIKLARLLEWLAYHRSAHIVALSLGMAEGIMACGIPKERITVIPNGSDLDLFNVPDSAGNFIREELGITDKQPLVVYTGTFGFINGIDYMARIAAEMKLVAPDIHFLLVGTGREKPKVIECAKRLQVLGDNLTIWEPVPKIKLPSILKAATLASSFVIPLPHKRHNSANKFFDALAAGRPVIINHEGWMADILRTERAGLVIPENNPAVAASLIANFVHDGEACEYARSAALRLAQERFNRDSLSAQVEQILLKCTKKD